MATSSITASFACNDAKAANAFVRLLAKPLVPVQRATDAIRVAEFGSDVEERCFVRSYLKSAKRRERACSR